MSHPAQPIRFFSFPLSGHAHRVKLLLSMLRLPFEEIDVDLRNGAHKQPDYLAKNVFGQVPVIEDGSVTLADSNAILVYLASKYDSSGRWYPRDPATAGEVQRWLSVAAGQLAAGPSSARRARVFGKKVDENAEKIAHALFGILESHLATRPFLVSEAPTIADLAIYSYTAHAPEGGVELEPYPALRAWLARVEGLPGFLPMPRTTS
jgi:glutathione S-transferase